MTAAGGEGGRGSGAWLVEVRRARPRHHLIDAAAVMRSPLGHRVKKENPTVSNSSSVLANVSVSKP